MDNQEVMTVLGPVPAGQLGVVDAHNHAWIEPVAGAAEGGPVLTDRAGILAELQEYRAAGGGGLLDCQPAGCGRNAAMLAELARASGVAIIACTGFHRRRYYAPGFWLWDASASADGDAAAGFFLDEIRLGLTETREADCPVKPGFIKVACEASLDQTPLSALEGAALAAAESGLAVEVHTERGQAVEDILDFFVRKGVEPRKVVLCHVDKRPDFGLHRELAAAAALLEYDTFYRPKYEPERNAWPLIERMVDAGLASSLALATDIAEASLWSQLGGGPGLAGLLTIIRPRLLAAGLSDSVVAQLLGGNIVTRL